MRGIRLRNFFLMKNHLVCNINNLGKDHGKDGERKAQDVEKRQPDECDLRSEDILLRVQFDVDAKCEHSDLQNEILSQNYKLCFYSQTTTYECSQTQTTIKKFLNHSDVNLVSSETIIHLKLLSDLNEEGLKKTFLVLI